MVGGFPRKPGMLRKDLLAKNSPIFVSQGKALNDNADPDCKVVVVANPANTNCLQLQRHCPKIPKQNFTALTRLDQNRAVAQIAAKIGEGTAVDAVQNVAIWGNHSSTMVPDASRAVLKKDKILIAKVGSKLESKWLESEFVSTVQTRGKAVLDAQKASSAMSAARAIADHLRDWLQGSGDRLVSMGVCSDGNPYEVKEGLIFSFPVKCFPGGKWAFEKELEISDFVRAGLKKTEEELVEEAGNLDAGAKVAPAGKKDATAEGETEATRVHVGTPSKAAEGEAPN
jgi:malate dehydrogenase